MDLILAFSDQQEICLKIFLRACEIIQNDTELATIPGKSMTKIRAKTIADEINLHSQIKYTYIILTKMLEHWNSVTEQFVKGIMFAVFRVFIVTTTHPGCDIPF